MKISTFEQHLKLDLVQLHPCDLCRFQEVHSASVMLSHHVFSANPVCTQSKWMITVAYALASAADAILAISLLTVVRRSRQNHKREEPLLDILVVYVINTGALTSLLSITSLIFVSVRSSMLGVVILTLSPYRPSFTLITLFMLDSILSLHDVSSPS